MMINKCTKTDIYIRSYFEARFTVAVLALNTTGQNKLSLAVEERNSLCIVDVTPTSRSSVTLNFIQRHHITDK
jgi:hypothetical protein